MKLLLIEDDKKLSEHLSESLKEHGFLVSQATTKEELTLTLRSSQRFEVIVMDRLLGSFDTKGLLQEMSEKWPESPKIVLSAISTPNERTDLLNLGADDYIGKPFSTQELIARIRVQLRRSSVPAGNFIQVGDLIIDSLRRVISVGDRAETLPSREFALLRTLAVDPSRIWSKEELLDYVWGQASNVETNVVESTVTNLRRRLEDLGANVSIRNMRNAGYWITS